MIFDDLGRPGRFLELLNCAGMGFTPGAQKTSNHKT